MPKDGPSAGITLAVALISLFSGRPARADTAMTGELTLRGLVLPIGGAKDKLIAAHQCGAPRRLPPKSGVTTADIQKGTEREKIGLSRSILGRVK